MKPVIIFDSGLGGVSISMAVAEALPHCDQIYAADNLWFPYGEHDPEVLTSRIVGLVGGLVETHRPVAVVVACNTASTVVLEDLRRAHDIPFVGTVPAIKPAAETTKSGLVSVLATPGTVRRDYTKDLIASFAAEIEVTLVGASHLAELAEAHLAGRATNEASILAEIRAAFVAEGERRTDIVVLGCTHYPLILDLLKDVAPWPVKWIDPAPAVARRLASVIGDEGTAKAAKCGNRIAMFSAPDKLGTGLKSYLAGKGFVGFGEFGRDSA